MILLDTSGLLAALFPDQRHHRRCAEALLEAKGPRILSPFVLAELHSLIARLAGAEAALALLDEVARGVYELAPFTDADIDEAREVIEQHRHLSPSLADASLVVLAGRWRTRDLLTLDQRRFRTLRPPGRRSFRILPDLQSL